MKKIVFYSSNSKKRDPNSNCTVFPSWASQWDEMAQRHPDCDITLVVQLNGRYFLDIADGKLVRSPEKIKLVTLPMEAKQQEFVNAVAELEPDIAIAMPGPVSGYDWNGIRDACIAEALRKKGIETICYPVDTALDCFDKWRTHQVLKAGGFRMPDALYLHHEMFTTTKLDDSSTGNVYQEYILWEISCMDMPVVIKSTTGSSSMGIYVAKDFEDAKSYLLSEKLTEDVIIEQFLKGEEFGAEIHGRKGDYFVSPPFRIFNTVEGSLNDPLGATTLKYGPILDESLHIEELKKELLRMAELMEFSGIIEVDLVLVNGEWYILEVNNRWSGITTLITASQGRLPYDVYINEAVSSEINYSDTSVLSFACQFKMPKVDLDVLKKMSEETCMKSIIQYEVRMKDKDTFWFNDAVMGGFSSINELLDGFDELQHKYPDQIPASLVKALRKKENK